MLMFRLTFFLIVSVDIVLLALIILHPATTVLVCVAAHPSFWIFTMGEVGRYRSGN